MIFEINGNKYKCNNHGKVRGDYYIIEILRLCCYEDFISMGDEFSFNGRRYSFLPNHHAYRNSRDDMECLMDDLNTIQKEDVVEPEENGKNMMIISSSNKEYISPGNGMNIKKEKWNEKNDIFILEIFLK